VSRTFWSKRDDKLLRSIYPWLPTPEVAEALGRSVCAIYGRVNLLGIEKSDAYLAEKKRMEMQRLRESGKAHRYPKGHVSANKGLHRPGYSIGRGRMQETQFAKGQQPHNTMPLWSFRVNTDGYLLLKTGKPGPKPNSGWEFVHRLVWEQANGPLPHWRKARIWWKDRNRLNCSLSNLELVSGADHVARTTMHNLPPAIREVIHLRGAINRTITWRTQREEQDRRSAQPPVRDPRSPEGQREAHGC
jgi:hypothetical protein